MPSTKVLPRCSVIPPRIRPRHRRIERLGAATRQMTTQTSVGA
jgi:hypothetical protein